MSGKGGGLKLGRIVRVRKDGNDIEFTSWNGEKRRAKYATFATVYGRKNERGWMLSVAVDKNATFNAADEWMNLFVENGVNISVDESAVRAAGERFGKGGGQSRRPSPSRDEENPFE